MNERLLLRLPHKQMAFTFPKVLCIFFRHDRNLYGEISRLIYRIIQTFSNAAAGRRIQSVAVVAYASAGRTTPCFTRNRVFVTRNYLDHAGGRG